MGSDDHNKPPKTIEEVGIHIGYMREGMQELKQLIQNISNGFASKAEVELVKDDLNDLDKRVGNLENKGTLKNTVQWVALVSTTLIAVISLYTLFTKGG